jgi:hypothetical protein
MRPFLLALVVPLSLIGCAIVNAPNNGGWYEYEQRTD